MLYENPINLRVFRGNLFIFFLPITFSFLPYSIISLNHRFSIFLLMSLTISFGFHKLSPSLDHLFFLQA